MRESVKRLKPDIHISQGDKHYSRLNVGNITRVEGGGYKLEGAIFATSNTREGILAVIGQLLERIDDALDEALREDRRAR
jgi:hypothetical protein